MPISHMEHFLLQTEDIEATKDWYGSTSGTATCCTSQPAART
jgi:hypothetical protein